MDTSSVGNHLVDGRECFFEAARLCPGLGSLGAGVLYELWKPCSISGRAVLRGGRMILFLARLDPSAEALRAISLVVSTGGPGFLRACSVWLTRSGRGGPGWVGPVDSCRNGSGVVGLGESVCHV